MGSSKDTTPDTAPVIRATSCLCLKSTVTFKLLFFVCLFFCRGQNGQLYGDIMRSSYYPCILYIFKSGTNFCQILCDEVLSLIYYLGHGCVCVCVCVCVRGWQFQSSPLGHFTVISLIPPAKEEEWRCINYWECQCQLYIQRSGKYYRWVCRPGRCTASHTWPGAPFISRLLIILPRPTTYFAGPSTS